MNKGTKEGTNTAFIQNEVNRLLLATCETSCKEETFFLIRATHLYFCRRNLIRQTRFIQNRREKAFRTKEKIIGFSCKHKMSVRVQTLADQLKKKSLQCHASQKKGWRSDKFNSSCRLMITEISLSFSLFLILSRPPSLKLVLSLASN